MGIPHSHFRRRWDQGVAAALALWQSVGARAALLRWSTIYKTVFQLASLYFIGLFAWHAARRPEAPWSLLIAGSVCWVFGHFERLRSIAVSLDGIKAEAEATVERAQIAVEVLRKTLTVLAAATVSEIREAGRMGGASQGEKDQRVFAILETLRSAGVDPKEIESIERSQDKWIIVDLVDRTSRVADKHRDAKTNPTWNAFWTSHSHWPNPPTPEELTALYEQVGCWNDEVREAVEDYRHFVAIRHIRRPEVWAHRD